MSNENHIDQLINGFLNGDLEGEELKAFEKMLKDDPVVRRRLDIYDTTNKLVMLKKLKEINSILQGETEKVKTKNSGSGNTGRILAGLVMVGIIAGLYLYSQEKEIPAPITDVNDKTDSMHIKPIIMSDHDTLTITVKKKSRKNRVRYNEKPVNELVPDIHAGMPVKIMDENVRTPVVQDTAFKQKNLSDLKAPETEASPKLSPCETVKIKADVQKEEPCRNEDNGQIKVYMVKGGTAPYTFTLNDTKENFSGEFSGLKDGIYQVKIADINGCQAEINNISLSAVFCRSDLEFCPSRGDLLKLPSYEKSGNLRIFDKSGALYFQESIAAGEVLIWDGLSASGEIKAGYYVFVIQYMDGTVQNGSITITP